MLKKYDFDVLIIGSGIAGLSTALELNSNFNIALISKGELFNSSSQYAQGGVAAVTESKDIESHVNDTLQAGAGLCDERAVAFTVENAHQSIKWLIEQGVKFTRELNNPNKYHLTSEGGHTERRIFHVADSTGAAIIQVLARNILKRSNIKCLTEVAAIDLLIKEGQCFGALIFDKNKQELSYLRSRITVLATGGASAVYFHTSNPKSTSGDGLAMAWRSGCQIANLEFNQFHPTSLYHPLSNSFLISEAVRGEGGILTSPDSKTRFMFDYDPRGELASRDIVSRAIAKEIHRNKIPYVLLDISHKENEEILRLFPMIAERCLTFGFDITKNPLPVVPASHYTCGGVVTDLNGETDISNLYAIGEVAYTGLHGANRMASNSLLECLVFAASASREITKKLDSLAGFFPNSFEMPLGKTLTSITNQEVADLAEHLRWIMSNYLGVLRNNVDIEKSKQMVFQIEDYFNKQLLAGSYSLDKVALRNRIMVSKLMILSAEARHESRGCHFNTDYPLPLPEAKPTYLRLNSAEL